MEYDINTFLVWFVFALAQTLNGGKTEGISQCILHFIDFVEDTKPN